ncbi:hypothetical protein CBR_g419 [Chara braunii]|uniref:Uncharacterized protein n=1 Tax=Chara braunii TaxID=69332 RepID=A0A388JQN8_CHABU|nr:hypothetical protein CBR_g419 [Chara braunii]|eukprot:GBG60088.1 hypothetical protein CBR_g419 [Chara braunii]
MDTENVACAALPSNAVEQEVSGPGGVKHPMSDSQLPPLSSTLPHSLESMSSPKRSDSERASAQLEEGIGIPTDQSEPMSGDGGKAGRQHEGAAVDGAEEEGRGGGLPLFHADEGSRSQTGTPCRDLLPSQRVNATTCEQQQQNVPRRQTVPPSPSALPVPPPSFRFSLPPLPPLPFPLSSASRDDGIAAGSLERLRERREREREPGSWAGYANAAGIGAAIGPMMMPTRAATNLPSPSQSLLLSGARRKWRSDINKREYDFCQLLGALQQEIVAAIADKDAERSLQLAEKASRLLSARKRVIDIADGRGWSCAELFERYTLAELSGNEEEKRRIVSEEEFIKRSSKLLTGRRRGGERKRTAIARPPTAKRSKII